MYLATTSALSPNLTCPITLAGKLNRLAVTDGLNGPRNAGEVDPDSKPIPVVAVVVDGPGSGLAPSTTERLPWLIPVTLVPMLAPVAVLPWYRLVYPAASAG